MLRRMNPSRPKQKEPEPRKLRLQLGAAPVVTEPLTGFVMGLPTPTPTPPPKQPGGDKSL